MDRDLISIQDVRNLLARAVEAQKLFAGYDQSRIDAIAQKMAEAGSREAERLARMAVEETGFGKTEDKTAKNKLATDLLLEYIKPLKTAGVLEENLDSRTVTIASPMGVIAAVIPSTNPTSTALNNGIISVKAGNCVVFSPHPAALECTRAAAEIMHEAAVAAGAPPGVIGCMSHPTMEGTLELMSHELTSVILATGGTELVKAAYGSGKPAFGVGPGNVPAYIHESADIECAVGDVLRGKSFDWGTICSSEQALICDESISARVIEVLKDKNAYMMNEDEIERVGKALVMQDGRINSRLVGRSPQVIAEAAGFRVRDEIITLVAPLKGVGPSHPLSREKLSPVLAFYIVKNWFEGCERCIEILKFGGLGHTMVIHSRDDSVIREFAMKKPVSRIAANTPAALGAVGLTTGLAPALTLGCGTLGGNMTSDNITPLHLIQLKRLAYGTERPGDMPSAKPVKRNVEPERTSERGNIPSEKQRPETEKPVLDREFIREVVRKVLDK